jgi:hypothetical protein
MTPLAAKRLSRRQRRWRLPSRERGSQPRGPRRDESGSGGFVSDSGDRRSAGLLPCTTTTNTAPAPTLLLCLLPSGSRLAPEPIRPPATARVPHRPDKRAAVAAVAGVAGRVPKQSSCSRRRPLPLRREAAVMSAAPACSPKEHSWLVPPRMPLRMERSSDAVACPAVAVAVAHKGSRDGQLPGACEPSRHLCYASRRQRRTARRFCVCSRGGSLLQTPASGEKPVRGQRRRRDALLERRTRGSDATLIGRWGVFETGALIPRADGGSIRRERSTVRWTAGSSVARGGRGFRAGWRSSFVATMTLAQ